MEDMLYYNSVQIQVQFQVWIVGWFYEAKQTCTERTLDTRNRPALNSILKGSLFAQFESHFHQIVQRDISKVPSMIVCVLLEFLEHTLLKTERFAELSNRHILTHVAVRIEQHTRHW